jgi:putative transposase
MPRYARIHVTGGMFHVISRFHDRRYYLDLEGARETYLKLLGQASAAHDARIIAYCLMSSHVHLVVQLGNDSIGTLTKRVHSAFGNWVNAKRNGVGSVMAGRPKSVLVHTETYGMELVRYVHNNPVRAGLVDRASESSWSSHRAYLGLEAPPSWLATEAVYGPDACEHETIRQEFATFVDEGREEQRRPEFSGDISPSLSKRIRGLMGGEFTLSYPIIGPDAFLVESLKEHVKQQQTRQRVSSNVTVELLIRLVFGELALPPELATSRSRRRDIALGRALVAWIWVEQLGRPQVMVAEGLKVRSAAISIMLRKLRMEEMSTEKSAVIELVLKEIVENGSDVANDEGAESTPANEPHIFALLRNRNTIK